MSAISMTYHGVMEGKGAYNRHARLPAGGMALALPWLEKAVQNIELDCGDQPVVIAADKTVKYEVVMNVMSDMKARGVKRVGLLVKSQ